MNDLKIARNILQTKELSLVIVKNGYVIFKTKETGIKGFLEAIEKSGNSLKESSIADKVVGKAIALLCVYAKVSEVYAKILSKDAMSLLKKYNINHEWSTIVEEILDFKKKQTCPFEIKAKKIIDPKTTYIELKSLLKLMNSK